tara:strand:- start:1191 stop:1625 length:435 start_codon:yes stop_codon:yes gene_type:complete
MFLGFDHFERTIDRLKKTSDGYPPYNIEQVSENQLRITLAVAGFTMDDLDVELENNQLTVRGKQTDDSDERIFLHRGIAARQFQRSFVLADGIEVKGASMDNGLLHIDMTRVIPEPQIQKIEISNNKKSNGTTAKNVIDVEGDK